MIKITGAVVLVLVFAVAAQAGHGANAHFTASPSTYAQGGGAGMGGGGTGGSGTILHVPPAHFAMQAVSGSASDYVPSTFVSYDSALAEGKASLDAHGEPLGRSAQRENSKPAEKSADLQIVQKQNGGTVIQH
jgi:hypothetical protein